MYLLLYFVTVSGKLQLVVFVLAVSGPCVSGEILVVFVFAAKYQLSYNQYLIQIIVVISYALYCGVPVFKYFHSFFAASIFHSRKIRLGFDAQPAIVVFSRYNSFERLLRPEYMNNDILRYLIE